MGTRTRDRQRLRPEAGSTVVAHAELIACVVSGAIARKHNIEHARNPYLVAFSDDSLAGAERRRLLRQAQAWSDGWEEVNLVMEADAARHL
jgi:hypothetical protein